MPNISSIQSVYLLLAFVVPGFIALFIRSKLLTGNLPAAGDAMMSSFVLSCLQAGVAFPLLFSHADEPIASRPPVFWLVYLFVAPIALGACLGADARFGWSHGLLRKLKISAVHPIPNSWDWRFSRGPSFVIVTLKDGSTVRGWFGAKSFASSDSRERDLFLEAVYVETESGKPWTLRPNTSILLAGGVVQSVEFVGEK